MGVGSSAALGCLLRLTACAAISLVGEEVVLCSNTNHPSPSRTPLCQQRFPPYRTTWRRCLAIVTLGLSAALFFSPIRVGPWWWQPVLAAAVLLVAVLLNANLIRSAGSGISIGWALRGPVATGMVAGVLGVATIMLARLSSMTEYDTSFVWACPGRDAGSGAGRTGQCAASAVSTQFAPRRSGGTTRLERRHGSQCGRGSPWPVRALALSATTGAVVFSLLVFLLYAGGGGVPFALLGGLLGRGLRALSEHSATKGGSL